MRTAKLTSAILALFALCVWSEQALVGAIGDCSSGLTPVNVNDSTCGGYSGTGQPCEFTGICSSPVETWMTSQPGCATGDMYEWDTAPVMSTCQNTDPGSGSCSYCGGGTTPTSGMECATGHLFTGGVYCIKKNDPEGRTSTELCAIVKYCGGSCCKL